MALGNKNFVPTDTPGPIDIVGLIAEYNKQHGAGAANGTTRSNTSQTSRSTSSDVTIYSLNQVRNIATNAFESALGRTPTADELNSFVTSLNTFSRANPNKTTRSATGTSSGTDTAQSNAKGTSTTKRGSSTDTSTSSGTTSGGVDVAGFAASQLQNTTEGQAVKADNLFRGALDALVNKLGG